MKKKLILCFTVLFISYGWAQENGDIVLSVHAGGSISNVSTSGEFVATNMRLGFNGGFGAEFYFAENWGLELSAYYNQNGFVIDETEISASQITRTLTLHYLTLALSPNFHFGEQRNWYLNAGPYAGFLLGANQGTTQVKDLYTSTNFGLTAGFGHKFSVSESGDTRLFIEIVQQLGLTDISEVDEDELSLKNRCSSLNIGVEF